MLTLDRIRSMSIKEIHRVLEAADDSSRPIPVAVVRHILRRIEKPRLDYGSGIHRNADNGEGL